MIELPPKTKALQPDVSFIKITALGDARRKCPIVENGVIADQAGKDRRSPQVA